MSNLCNQHLMEFSRQWELDGDLIRCRYCNAALIASRDGEALIHGSGCVVATADNEHPWHQLRKCLGQLGFKHVRVLRAERDALHESYTKAVDTIDDLRKMEADIQMLRAEAAILMDLVNEIPEDVLNELPSGKVRAAYNAMSKSDKHEFMRTTIDKLASENKALRRMAFKTKETK